MRRLRRSSAEPFGGLAGWLFADVAIVLAIALAASQVIRQPDDDGAITEPTPTTLPKTTETTTFPDDQRGSVDVKEIVLSDVCIDNPGSTQLTETAIKEKLREAQVPEETKFGVVLVYAGYRESVPTEELATRQDDAKKRAETIRDTLRLWSRLSQERWVKDLGHDAGTNLGCYKFYLLRELE